MQTIKPHMAAAGLGFTQPIEMLANGGEAIRTIVFHVEDEKTIESQIELPGIEFKGMNLIQSKGSIITYLRRYSLMSILGIVTDDDDTDAQGATTKPAANTNQGAQAPNKAAQATQSPGPIQPAAPAKPWLNPLVNGAPNPLWNQALKYLADGGKISDIKTKYRIGKNVEEQLLNESLTFDDLPFDRADVEDAEIASTSGNELDAALDTALKNDVDPTIDVDTQANMNFDNPPK